MTFTLDEFCAKCRNPRLHVPPSWVFESEPAVIPILVPPKRWDGLLKSGQRFRVMLFGGSATGRVVDDEVDGLVLVRFDGEPVDESIESGCLTFWPLE